VLGFSAQVIREKPSWRPIPALPPPQPLEFKRLSSSLASRN
jgi:hypothetical protein